MVKKFLKSKSKRMPAKKRYKIERKVREHNRKVKKSEKLKQKYKSGKKKIITVPGDCPFKEAILTEAIALRQKIQTAKIAKREEFKAIRKLKRAAIVAEKRNNPQILKSGILKLGPSPKENVEKKEDTFADLLKRAEQRGYFYEKFEEKKEERDSSLKAFYKEFQQVIGDSDVIIQVLDARDPLGTRSSEAEEAVRSHNDKKLILVLNKCDLIPVENLQKWIKYLRQTAGCVVLPFKGNTQKQKDRFGSVGSVNLSNSAAMDTKKSIGASDLLGLLGNWARGEAGGLTVGVVGMPNVGKSSLINSLKRSKACNVGAKPGVTRACQLVHLDSKLKLIDSPGVCFSKEKGAESMSVETILKRVPKSTLMLQYGISAFESEDEFLLLLAAKCGQMKKGGIPNPAAAQQKVIQDWHTGTIRFFTEPPELDSSTTSVSFVPQFSEEFNIDKFLASAEKDPDIDMENTEENNENNEEMDEDNAEQGPVTRSKSRKSVSFAVNLISPKNKVGKKSSGELKPSLVVASHGVVSSRKVLMKKMRKSKKKSTKQAGALAELIQDFTL